MFNVSGRVSFPPSQHLATRHEGRHPIAKPPVHHLCAYDASAVGSVILPFTHMYRTPCLIVWCQSWKRSRNFAPWACPPQLPYSSFLFVWVWSLALLSFPAQFPDFHVLQAGPCRPCVLRSVLHSALAFVCSLGACSTSTTPPRLFLGVCAPSKRCPMGVLPPPVTWDTRSRIWTLFDTQDGTLPMLPLVVHRARPHCRQV